MKIEKLLKNKFLYYAALGLAALNVLGYVTQGSMTCILAFGVTYYCAHSYTKNRTLDIFAGLFVANILFGCGRVKEGMTALVKSNADAAAENAEDAAAACVKHLDENKCTLDKQCRWKAATKKCLDAKAAVEDAAAADPATK
jgi:hypothetical protein